MEDLKNKTETLTDHVGDYVELYYKLVVLNATEKATGIASVSITSIVVGVLVVFVLFFASLGVGWWLGEELNSMIGGFSIIAGFYLLVITIMMALRKQIIPSIQNTIIKKIYEENDNIVSGSDRRETGVAKAA
jgi:hypothetical protein